MDIHHQYNLDKWEQYSNLIDDDGESDTLSVPATQTSIEPLDT